MTESLGRVGKPVNIVMPVAPPKVETAPAEAPQERTLATVPVTTVPQAEVISKVITTRDLSRPEVVGLIREKAKQHLEVGGQLTLDTASLEKRIETAIAPLIEQKIPLIFPTLWSSAG